MKKNNILYLLRRKMQVIAYDVFGAERMSKFYFNMLLGYKLDLENPKTFNEKLQWLKLYYWPNCDKAIECADKSLVGEYLKYKNMSNLQNDILFTYDDAKDIEWDKLPNKFVLKCNHGCRYNIICDQKQKFQENKVKKKLGKWMKEDFGKFNAEPHYSRIHRKIICEKYLEGEILNYNIYCFNGKAIFFSLAGGLGKGDGEHLTYYYANGEKAPFKNKLYPNKENTLSPILPKLIETAELLSSDFPMVRVDLFDVNGEIVLSEMTFTPGGALIPFDSYDSDLAIGKLLNIEKLICERRKENENK